MYFYVHSAFSTLKSYYFSRSPHFLQRPERTLSAFLSVSFAFQNSRVAICTRRRKKNGAAPTFIKLFGKNAYNGLLIQKKSLRLSYVRLCTRLSS